MPFKALVTSRLAKSEELLNRELNILENIVF